MMSVNDAYMIVRKKGRMFLYKVDSILDYGDFYVFFMKPFYIRDSDTYDVGTHFPRVNKKTGKYDIYDITENPDAYLNAKKIEFKDPFREKVKK